MKITNELFQQALRSTSAICKGKAGPDDQVKLLKMEADKNIFKMMANNSGQYAVAEFECEDKLAPICVPAHTVLNIAPLFEKNVTITMEGTKLKIHSGGLYFVPTQSVDDFTAISVDKLTKIGVNCGDVAECIDKVKFSAKKTDERPALHGVNVRLASKKIIAEACTGHTLAIMEKAGISAEAAFLIPLPFVANVITALKTDGAVLSTCETRIMVEYTGGCYSCVLQSAPFPNLQSQISGKHPNIGKFKPETWLPTFRAILTQAGKEGELSCLVKIKDGRINFENEKGCSVDRPLDDLKKALCLNAVTFTPVLEAFGDVEVKVSVYDGEGAAVCLEHGDLTVLSTQLRS